MDMNKHIVFIIVVILYLIMIAVIQPLTSKFKEYIVKKVKSWRGDIK